MDQVNNKHAVDEATLNALVAVTTLCLLITTVACRTLSPSLTRATHVDTLSKLGKATLILGVTLPTVYIAGKMIRCFAPQGGACFCENKNETATRISFDQCGCKNTECRISFEDVADLAANGDLIVLDDGEGYSRQGLIEWYHGKNCDGKPNELNYLSTQTPLSLNDRKRLGLDYN